MSTLVATVRGWSKIDFLGWMLTPATEATEGFIVWAWRYLLGHLMFRYSKGLILSNSFKLYPCLCVGLMGIALLLSFAPFRFIRISKLLAPVAVAIEMTQRFPVNDNHTWLETVILVLFLLMDFKQPTQRELFVAMGRWIMTLLMFHSALQKILHGEFFNGMFLATLVNERRPKPFLEILLGSEEFDALRRTLENGLESPIALHSPFALALSNLVYLAELFVAVLLLAKPTRAVGAKLGVLVLLAIEAVARVLPFGFLALNLLALFFPLTWRRRVCASTVLAYICLLAVYAVVGRNRFV